MSPIPLKVPLTSIRNRGLLPRRLQGSGSIARREKELEARVRKPAEAERYKLERLAAAEK